MISEVKARRTEAMFSVREIANLKVKSGRLAAQSKYRYINDKSLNVLFPACMYGFFVHTNSHIW